MSKETGKKLKSPTMKFFFIHMQKQKQGFILQHTKNKEKGILFIAVVLLSFENTFIKQ